jgi:hypothetical protein
MPYAIMSFEILRLGEDVTFVALEKVEWTWRGPNLPALCVSLG